MVIKQSAIIFHFFNELDYYQGANNIHRRQRKYIFYATSLQFENSMKVKFPQVQFGPDIQILIKKY